jgi:hypothetical protein
MPPVPARQNCNVAAEPGPKMETIVALGHVETLGWSRRSAWRFGASICDRPWTDVKSILRQDYQILGQPSHAAATSGSRADCG